MPGVTAAHCCTEVGEVTWWAGSRAVHHPSQDALAVHVRPSGLPAVRLAVADGVTPCARTPEVAGMDGARYAAQLAVAGVGTHLDVRRACDEVNRALRAVTAADGGSLLSRERPTTGLAVVDVPRDGGPVMVFSAYDCEVYVRSDGGWREVLPADRSGEQSAAYMAERARFIREHPGQLAALVEAEAGLLADDPLRWGVVPLGALEQVYLRSAVLPRAGLREIVVASDGARLTPRRLEEYALGDWLTGLRAWERADPASHGEVKLHDDVSAVHVELVNRG
jgi:hypothetical protein